MLYNLYLIQLNNIYVIRNYSQIYQLFPEIEDVITSPDINNYIII